MSRRKSHLDFGGVLQSVHNIEHDALNTINLNVEDSFVVKSNINLNSEDLSTSTYNSIFNMSVLDKVNLKVIKIKTDTTGILQLLVNGEIEDYYRISSFDVNPKFLFYQDLNINITDNIEIKFIPESISLTTYNFFIRIEGYKQNGD